MVLPVQYKPRSSTWVLRATGYTGSQACHKLIRRSSLYRGTLSVTETQSPPSRPLPFCPAFVPPSWFRFIWSWRGRWLVEESPLDRPVKSGAISSVRGRCERRLFRCASNHNPCLDKLTCRVHPELGTAPGNWYFFCIVPGDARRVEKEEVRPGMRVRGVDVYVTPEQGRRRLKARFTRSWDVVLNYVYQMEEKRG